MPYIGMIQLVWLCHPWNLSTASTHTGSCVVGTFSCALLTLPGYLFPVFQPLPSGRQSPTKNTLNGSPSKCPRFVKIKNWETGSVLHDTLHLKTAMVSRVGRTGQNSLSITERMVPFPRWIHPGMPWWRISVSYPAGFEFPICCNGQREENPPGINKERHLASCQAGV